MFNLYYSLSQCKDLEARLVDHSFKPKWKIVEEDNRKYVLVLDVLLALLKCSPEVSQATRGCIFHRVNLSELGTKINTILSDRIFVNETGRIASTSGMVNTVSKRPSMLPEGRTAHVDPRGYIWLDRSVRGLKPNIHQLNKAAVELFESVSQVSLRYIDTRTFIGELGQLRNPYVREAVPNDEPLINRIKGKYKMVPPPELGRVPYYFGEELNNRNILPLISRSRMDAKLFK